MFEEFNTVVLTHEIKEYKLKAGDVGTVVHVYKEAQALEVEFLTVEGKTIAVLTLKPSDVRSFAQNEILHVRGVASAQL
jgi:hypothetical protein